MERPPNLPYRDRRQAGHLLAEHLARFADRDDVTVLALPRGGVPVAFEVASALDAPLDVFVVRKLGLPGFEEFAMGAIASGGVRILNSQARGVSRPALEAATQREQAELQRRERLYRQGAPALRTAGRTLILVDDGLATGATMRSAVAALRIKEPARIVVAVPVGAGDACDILRAEADEVVCPATPEPFRAVGEWFVDFTQTGDDEVRQLLARVHAPAS